MTTTLPGVSGVASAVAMVPIGADAEVARLARDRDGEVFTARERRLCVAGRGLEGWAGRLAAKRAVARVLDRGAGVRVRLADIEIVPRATALCTDPDRCPKGHPPSVRLHGAASHHVGWAGAVEISISHTRTVAVGLALLLGEGGL